MVRISGLTALCLPDVGLLTQGEKPYFVICRNTFRISSSIAVTENELIFGCSTLDGKRIIQGKRLRGEFEIWLDGKEYYHSEPDDSL